MTLEQRKDPMNFKLFPIALIINAIALLALIVALVVGLVGCDNKRVPHPNEVDAIDGQTYDILVVTQAFLDETRAQHKAGNLPNVIKPYFDNSATVFNEALEAWKLYRSSVGSRSAGAANGSDLKAKMEALRDELTQANKPIIQGRFRPASFALA
jgi:hypothetical protein